MRKVFDLNQTDVVGGDQFIDLQGAPLAVLSCRSSGFQTLILSSFSKGSMMGRR